jgi:hypothetical protein
MAKANTHLTHLEELVLTQGPVGYKMARAFLLKLLQTLKGNTKSSIQTSVKWDGAPAIFAGINPENGKFFVGTKSIFNKVPKINYTEEDIIKNHGHAPGLVDKLTKALKYLPSLKIKNILQGDFMFDDGMIDTVDIQGEPHYRFKPNTIVYAVPVNSKLGEQIGKSKFGIVFHTTYDSLDSGASFGADVSNLRETPGVWFDDAFFTDDTGIVTLTEEEESEIVQLVKQADSVNEKINYEDLPSAFLNIYINSEIKGGSFLENPEKSFEGFINWYSQRIQKKINNLKSDKGKQRATENAQQTLQSFNDKKEDILNIFKVSRLLFEAKNIFIEKYNNAVYNTKHFVDNGSGDLIASNPEGYVAVDHRGNGIKFVDRLEFSRANFAIDKGDKFSAPLSEEDEYDPEADEWYELRHQMDQELGEPEEDEDDDPVVDASYPKTVAIVPGAFKPPHKGHADMVRRYATGDGVEKADKVYVVISAPMNAQRTIRARIDGKLVDIPIDANNAIALWKKLFPEVANLPEVEFEIAPSDMRSPITLAFKYISDESPLPLNDGDRVMLGASDKPDTKGEPDWCRWNSVDKEKHVKPGIELLCGEQYAVPALARGGDKDFSATDMRDLISDLAEDPGNKEAYAELIEFVPADKIPALLDELLPEGSRKEIEEMSAVGVGSGGIGSLEGPGAPLGSTLVKRGGSTPGKRDKPKTKKKKTKKEYIDLGLLAEVMELIIERGINNESK